MLKIKLNIETKNIFLFIFNYVVKFTLTKRSLKNIILEIENYNKLEKSIFFKDYLVPSFKVRFFFIMAKYSMISKKEEKFFFKEYLNRFNKELANNEKNIDKYLDFEKTKKFIQLHLPIYEDTLYNLISNSKIIITPCHGDLHPGNIVKNNNKYFLIDWGLYNQNGCFIFDLINYKIFSSKYYKNDWFLFLIKYHKKYIKFLDQKYFDLYVIWKIENELKTVKLTEFKIEKYKNILKSFFKS